jgi:hypothetical protein
MPKTHAMKEVEVLQFFEEAPIEKAETVFNIVSDKIRARMARSDEPARRRQKRVAVTATRVAEPDDRGPLPGSTSA